MTRRLLVAPRTIKALEDVRYAFARNYRSVIAGTDLDAVTGFLHGNCKPAPGTIVFHRVLDQVLQRQLDHIAVAEHWELFGKLSLYLEVILLPESTSVFHGALD